MFTWICPQCGREVPPAYNECPDCAAKNAPAGATVPQPPLPPAPVARPAAAGGPPEYTPPPAAAPLWSAAPPPVYQAPQAPQVPQAPPPYAPPPVAVRHAGTGVPTWLLTILFVFAFLGLGAGIYWTVGYFRGSSTAPSATTESPAAKPGAKTSPFQKYIEISGVRFGQDAKKKTQVSFMLTNHSPADIPGLAGNVTIWGRTQKSEEDAQGTFSFTTDIGPSASKELTVPLNTKLKIYELPDWQNITTDIQITAPGESSQGSAAPR